MKKTALIDSSSAILLHKVDLLATMVRVYHLAMVPAVYAEITLAGRSGARKIRDACSGGLIELVQVGAVEADHTLASLGAGERSTLMAFDRGDAHFIIMDDRKGALACRSKDIPYINALLCPKVLHHSGHIDTPVYQAAFQRLQRIGRYSPAIKEYAERCTSQMLAGFFPDPF